MHIYTYVYICTYVLLDSTNFDNICIFNDIMEILAMYACNVVKGRWACGHPTSWNGEYITTRPTAKLNVISFFMEKFCRR